MKVEDIELQLVYRQESKEVIHNLGGWEIHQIDTVVMMLADFLVGMGFSHKEIIREFKSYGDELDELEEAYQASSKEIEELEDPLDKSFFNVDETTFIKCVDILESGDIK